MVAGKRKAEDDNSAMAGTFSSALEGPASKAKRQKKVSNAVAESQSSQQEKRLARFKSSCPKNIMERVARVMTQRFAFLPFVFGCHRDYSIQVLYDRSQAGRKGTQRRVSSTWIYVRSFTMITKPMSIHFIQG